MAANWLVITLSLSQLIMLLLTTLTGRESNHAARHFSGKGVMMEETQTHRQSDSSHFVFLLVFRLFACVCVCVSLFTVILFCASKISSACLCGYEPAPPSLHACCKCLSAVNTLQPPCCLQTGFSAWSQTRSPNAPLRPQWLILTHAAAVSNQHSQPRT